MYCLLTDEAVNVVGFTVMPSRLFNASIAVYRVDVFVAFNAKCSSFEQKILYKKVLIYFSGFLPWVERKFSFK